MTRALSTSRRLLATAGALVALVAVTATPSLAQHEMSGGGGPTIIRGFTDVTWRSGGWNTGRNAAFELGQFDLFITSQLADRFSFVGETVFEFDETAGEFVVDVERAGITYAIDDHLRLTAGKVHTPLGYWNNAYHHGLALQPTIERPLLMKFEDEGGPLPIHTVGVQLSGRDLGAAHLGFDVLVGNGLGNRPVADSTRTPSITLAAHSQLTPSLRVGVSGYRAVSEPGSETPAGSLLASRLTQTIGGAFATWFTQRAEAIIEAQQVMDQSAGQRTTSPGWFAYGGIRVSPRIVPYAMHDQVRLAANDPYFAPVHTRRETLGVRFEQSAAVVLKLEGRSIEDSARARAKDVALQLAVAF